MLWLLLLCLVLVIVSLLFALWALSPYHLSSLQKKPDLKPNVKTNQRLLFKTLAQHLDAANIVYWVVRDTLADVVDNHSMFDQRDVLNIAVLREYDRQLLHLKPNKQSPVVFVMEQISDGYMCYMNHVNDFPCIHIAMMEQHAHELVPCTSHETMGHVAHSNNHHLRADIYLMHHVFPLRESRTKDGILVPVPNNDVECARIFRENTHTTSPYVKLFYNQRTKNILKNLRAAWQN